jgi:single-stranded-DNA-specific exonuclease
VEAACDPAAADRLSRELSLHPLLARVLACRGFGDPALAERFLDPHLADLPDPFSMRGMEEGVLRIVKAIEAGERIGCYGDYDADGLTSLAVLTSFLRACGADPVTYVPNRLTEGYGLNRAAIEALAGQGIRLLISLDCGITSVDEIAVASRLGLDTIIVDHHTAPAALPGAVAILNPHQPGCEYPSKHLAAVGVTFCLAMALRKRLREKGHFGVGRAEPNLLEALDLVALGTIADVVPLLDVNRILVRWGLRELAQSRRPGIRALKQVAGIPDDAPVTAGQVGFRLAPRINAAGRLEDAGRGLRLLLEQDSLAAAALAAELDSENRSRQEIERQMLEEALVDARDRVESGARGLVLAREGWHPGVVGIVASRIVEQFYRPTVLIGMRDGVGKGSGRSIEGFHLHDALMECSEHLVRFGGHRHAAGVTIEPSAIPAFRDTFERIAAARLTEEDLVQSCRIEGRVDGRQLSESAALALEQLAPYGAGNPEPLFAVSGVPERPRTVGAGGAHLKMKLSTVDAIGFSLGDRLSICSGEVEAAVAVGLDAWNGVRRVQLRVKDLRSGGFGETAKGCDPR